MKLTKIIKENFAGITDADKTKFDKIISATNYEQFTKKLSTAIKDPKIQFLLNYALDDHILYDDEIEVEKICISCNKLIPTQSEIDVEKSLKLLNGSGNIISLLDGYDIILGDLIVTVNGEYIIDGHHRWSQVYMFNPEATMRCLNINGISSWLEALKKMQLAIASEVGDLPVSSIKGKNLYNCNKSFIFNFIKDNIDQNVATLIVNHVAIKNVLDNKFIKNNDDTAIVCEYIWNNIQHMKKNNKPVKNASKRSYMPQTDQAPATMADLYHGIYEPEIPVNLKAKY